MPLPKTSNQRRTTSRTNHAMNLMASLGEMKRRDFLCDFTIKVGVRSFLVHRTVLAACSSYFEAMFSSHMKEYQEGFVDMKDVDPDSMKKCIDFMYSGELVLNTDEVESVLHASNLIQLEQLTDRCLKFLKNNLSAENCLFTFNMSRLYGRKDVTSKAEEYIRENFESVASSEMFPFVCASDLARYLTISDCDYTVLWNAIVTWLNHNGENNAESFERIIKFVNADVFPFNFLLDTAINEPALQNFNRGTELLLSNIFSNAQALRINLNVDNCFKLHHMNGTRKHAPDFLSAENTIFNYMAFKFGEIFDQDDFLKMSRGDVLKLFQRSQEKNKDCQRAIWHVTIKWTSHRKSRIQDFPDLFCAIKLKNLPCSFLRDPILSNALVWESKICVRQVLGAITNRVISADGPDRNHVPCIAVFSTEVGKIETLEIPCRKWSFLTDIPDEDFRKIVSLNGRIFLLGDGLLSLDSNGHWQETSPTKKRKPCPWCQVVAFQGALYVVDGRHMARYDPSRNHWVENLPGCGLVMGFFVAADDTSLYAMGGQSAKKYDPRSQKWSSIAPMKIQRYDAAATTFGGKVYVMGGTLFGKFFKSVECYTPRTNSWSEVGNMREARSHFSASVVQNKIYAVGGAKRADGCGDCCDTVEVYDVVTQQWEVITTTRAIGSRVLSCFFKLDVTEAVSELEAALEEPPPD